MVILYFSLAIKPVQSPPLPSTHPPQPGNVMACQANSMRRMSGSPAMLAQDVRGSRFGTVSLMDGGVAMASTPPSHLPPLLPLCPPAPLPPCGLATEYHTLDR